MSAKGLRVPHMTQVTARVCHEAAIPAPEGLVFDEATNSYVAHPEVAAALHSEGRPA